MKLTAQAETVWLKGDRCPTRMNTVVQDGLLMSGVATHSTMQYVTTTMGTGIQIMGGKSTTLFPSVGVALTPSATFDLSSGAPTLPGIDSWIPFVVIFFAVTVRPQRRGQGPERSGLAFAVCSKPA